MTFPVYISLGPWQVHPHGLFDFLAYVVGGQVYWLLRRQGKVQRHPFEKMMWVIVGMAGGAMVGAKVLAWAEMWPTFWAHHAEPAVWLGGKTIAGGLMGGWIGVEIAKRFVGLRESTGDSVVFAVIVGIAIGRLGCFFTGLSDNTYGIASSLPWAVNFGDGVPRHPTQLYESAFLLALGAGLWMMRRHQLPNGTVFRLFMASYLLFRFAIEFIKPREFRAACGLSPIQIASALGAIVALISLRRVLSAGDAEVASPARRQTMEGVSA